MIFEFPFSPRASHPLEGRWVVYYESGGVLFEVNYVDGKLEGKWVGYNEEET